MAAVVCRSLGNTGGDVEYNVNGASSGYPIVVPVHGHWHPLLHTHRRLDGDPDGERRVELLRRVRRRRRGAVLFADYRQGYVADVQNQPAASKIYVWGNSKQGRDSSISFGC